MYPSEAGHDCHAYDFIVEAERRRHAHAAYGVVHSDVQVLDVLPDHLDRKVKDRQATLQAPQRRT